MRKPRKFNRHLAHEIMEGKQRGRILTRDGRPVRIVAWDARGPHPIVGLIYMAGLNVELSWQWTRRGVAFGLYAEQETTLNFDLVIDLKQDNERLTVPRLRRSPNKKRK